MTEPPIPTFTDEEYFRVRLPSAEYTRLRLATATALAAGLNASTMSTGAVVNIAINQADELLAACDVRSWRWKDPE